MKPLNPSEVAVLNELQAAQYIGLSRSSLRQQRMNGPRGKTAAIPFLKLGRSVRYRKIDLDAFLAAHIVDPGAGRGQ